MCFRAGAWLMCTPPPFFVELATQVGITTCGFFVSFICVILFFSDSLRSNDSESSSSLYDEDI